MPQQCFWLKPELIRLHCITIHILPPLCNILLEFQLPQILLCKGTSSLSKLVAEKRKPICLCFSLLFNLCMFGIFWTNAFLKYFNFVVHICSSNRCATVTLTGSMSALCLWSPVSYFSSALPYPSHSNRNYFVQGKGLSFHQCIIGSAQGPAFLTCGDMDFREGEICRI